MTTTPHTTAQPTPHNTGRAATGVLGAGLLALGTVAGAGTAAAVGDTPPPAPPTPPASAFSNGDGTVRCEVLPENGTVSCIVTSQQAREKMPECAPPGQLEPSVTVTRDEGRVECRNQGLTAEPELLPAGQERVVDDWTVTASDDGSLAIFDGDGLRAVAGPEHLEARAPLAAQDAPGGVTVR
jgi:hypothetical protein